MTLSDTIKAIEKLAAGSPSVSSIVRNDIFRLNTLYVYRKNAFLISKEIFL